MNKKSLKKKVSVALVAFLVSSSLFSMKSSESKVEASRVVNICIDPGHGGTGGRNLGAQYNGLSEKEITLKVANAMKEELSKYEGVNIYMTRTTDTEISLKNRAAYAASVNADFVYSIHFNASTGHDLCGSEVWTSGFGSFYQKGYSFGEIEENELLNLGIYPRGVKTKLGTNGDYYGIINNSRLFNIPCVIIEHCYLDQGADLNWLKSSKDPYTILGKADATAVAKYFGLSSSLLKVNYGNYPKNNVVPPKFPKGEDLTNPTVCKINSAVRNKSAKTITANISVKDPDTMIIYYKYSLDGGISWSSVVGWNRALETDTVVIPNPNNSKILTIRAYNQYDLTADSLPVIMK